MRCTHICLVFLLFSRALAAFGQSNTDSYSEFLHMPAVGASSLRIITPNTLELFFVTTKKPDPARVTQWDFVNEHGDARLPAVSEFAVNVGGKTLAVKTVGFKRRVLYAPLKARDLRIANYLYLQLDGAIPNNQPVEVKNPSRKFWPANVQFTATMEPLRWSPVLHVNQTGYLPGYPKKAMVGFYLGSLGELEIDGANGSALDRVSDSKATFQVLNRANERVFEGPLKFRRDKGFTFDCYQHVLEADFSELKTNGEYRLYVPRFGTSFPFYIDDGIAGAFARTYALGIYHQRCGTNNVLPWTRFVHAVCHAAPAEVPTMSKKFESVNESLAKESANFKDNPRHAAPQLKSVAASLYPFVNPGPLDVRGGHHDAGDYSKYTINSAAFVHHLVFAADVFPGVSELDNLGLPESGDGKSDVLQEAKWEADFLAKMQDADGGFYFLVYPRDREYENDVTPDRGDPQILFPKTTSVTAAAVAALAQCASSPTFKKQFPDAAAQYLDKARKGWSFLERAIAKYGKDGAYQKITHYGDEFMHDDELAWAACELFIATGDEAYHRKLRQWFDPSDANTRRWGWWRLYDSWGCAIRSYAFAARSGKIKKEQLNQFLLEQCENEIYSLGEEQLKRAEQSAYGTSFPEETKHAAAAGWYFSSDAAFDLAVAYQLSYPEKRDPRPKIMEAIISNLNYEEGCNPVNVVYLTGLGWKRQREIVHQYAQNDRRILPPSGIPLGNMQAGFGWNYLYQKELDALSFPPDGAEKSPYPFYDRWGDGFNLSQEFVAVNQARALAYLAWIMAQSPLKTQPWNSATAQITGMAKPASGGKSTLGLTAAGLDLSSARIVWEAAGQEPAFGQTLTLSGNVPAWVEAAAQLPDGRRVFGVSDAKPK